MDRIQNVRTNMKNSVLQPQVTVQNEDYIRSKSRKVGCAKRNPLRVGTNDGMVNPDKTARSRGGANTGDPPIPALTWVGIDLVAK